MELTQNWVGYLDRSYEQIKRSCLKRLTYLAPEITDHSESNPLIIILSMFAGIGEMINLYIDNKAREIYLGTCRKYSSIVRIAELIDYNIKANNPATADLLFYLVNSTTGEPAVLPTGSLVIPFGTVINSAQNFIPFVLRGEVVIVEGKQSNWGKAIQYETILGEILGTTTGAPNQQVAISGSYAEGSMKLVINNEPWVLYRGFGTMKPNTKGFVISIDENQNAFIEFGDGLNGMIPTLGQTIFADYQITAGLAGNLPIDQVTQIQGSINGVPPGMTLKVTNPNYTAGGANFESLEEIRNRAPRSLRTLERAVTYQDFIDLCLLVPGVGSADLKYCCGKFIDIYIAPNSPGIATQLLLQAVYDYLICRKMITTQIAVHEAGVTKLWIKAKIYGQPLKSEVEVYNAVADMLDLKYGYSTLKINSEVSIPKIIANIENLTSMVARVELEEVRIQPYARTVGSTTVPLNIQFISLPHSSTNIKYTIVYRLIENKFEVYRDNSYVGLFNPGVPINDNGIIIFQLEAGNYGNNNRWEFMVYKSYPEIFPISLIKITDFTAPIIDVAPIVNDQGIRLVFSDLQIITQTNNVSCLPSC